MGSAREALCALSCRPVSRGPLHNAISRLRTENSSSPPFLPSPPSPPPPLLSGCFVPSVPAAQCDIYGFLLGGGRGGGPCAEAAIIPAANPPPSSPLYPHLAMGIQFSLARLLSLSLSRNFPRNFSFYCFIWERCSSLYINIIYKYNWWR